MKNFFIVTIFLLVFVGASYTFASEQIQPNAYLIEVSNYLCSPRRDINLLVPKDAVKYPLINKNPLVFFTFINFWDEYKINSLSLKEIKSGKLGRCSQTIPFSKISGFSFASEIGHLDEFDLLDKKETIIENLKTCYLNYKNEYSLYRSNIFVFINPIWASHADRIPLKGFERWRNKIYVTNHYDQIGVSEINRDQYNFDTKMIQLPLFGFTMKHGWERDYASKYNEYFSKKFKKDIPERIEIPLPIDAAKMLFSKSKKAFCETRVKVQPRDNYRKYSGAAFKVLNIKKILTPIEGDGSYEYLIESDPSSPIFF